MAATTDVGRFAGFPPEALDLYARLELDNTKAFWQANKAVYDESVKAPLLALTAELADEFGPFHLFRPHRDVRFSKDKSPYKTHQGAVTEGEGGEAYYLHLDAHGMFVASGYYRMAKDQLERYRTAVDDDVTGPDLQDRVATVGRRHEIGGEARKMAPRGSPRDHPRIELLRHKGLIASRALGAPGWLSTRRAVSEVAKVWRAAAPINEWLAAHVGPSTELPDELAR